MQRFILGRKLLTGKYLLTLVVCVCLIYKLIHMNTYTTQKTKQRTGSRQTTGHPLETGYQQTEPSLKQRNESDIDKFDRSMISNIQHIINVYNNDYACSDNVNKICDVVDGRLKSFNLRIIVIVFNRHKSLLRLLNSLNEGEYYNDDIKLEIWIDRSRTETVHEQTLACAKNFTFIHGEKSVHVHLRHVGIYGQWLATLGIKDDGKEIPVIFEDDLTVSKYFYKYLKMAHAKYDKYPNINGYALQGVSIKHGLPEEKGWLRGPENQTVFLYPVLGTWGLSPNPANWKLFINWMMNVFKDKPVFVPSVPGNVAATWYENFRKTKKHDSMWEMWHIYFAWCNKEYTLYSNFDDHMGLTTNWMEEGLHYSGGGQDASNKLVMEWKAEYESLPDNPVHLNLYGELDFKDASISRNFSLCKLGFP